MNRVCGYINLFEGECCFVGERPDCFRLLKEGDRVFGTQPEREYELRLVCGEWRLENAQESVGRLQGRRVIIEVEPPVE